MSASLEAVTAAPGTTAPDASLTTPEIVLCADAIEGNRTVTAVARHTKANLVLVILSPVYFVLRRVSSSETETKPCGPIYVFIRTVSRVTPKIDSCYGYKNVLRVMIWPDWRVLWRCVLP